MNKRLWVSTLVGALLLTGCSTGSGDTAQAQPSPTVSVNGATPGGDVIPSATAAATTPDNDGTLPTFTGLTTAGQYDAVMRQIVVIAAQDAQGTPAADRHPPILTTSDAACGVKVDANACPPTTARQQVVIYLNPDVTMANADQDGNATLQDAVLGAYMSYLMFRTMQREHPDMLTGTTDAIARVTLSVQLCVTGQVMGGLWNHHAASQQLTDMFQADANVPDFIKGTHGGSC